MKKYFIISLVFILAACGTTNPLSHQRKFSWFSELQDDQR